MWIRSTWNVKWFVYMDWSGLEWIGLDWIGVNWKVYEFSNLSGMGCGAQTGYKLHDRVVRPAEVGVYRVK